MHIHLHESLNDPSATALLQLPAKAIAAAHLKSEEDRGRGKKWEEKAKADAAIAVAAEQWADQQPKVKVIRAGVTHDFMQDLVRRGAQAAPD